MPVGTIGELWFRGPSLMEGYYGRERHEIFTPDGWYRTGDLFHVDADGFFYFHGRRGSMIKTAGANVSPLEVEAALSDATGGLAVMVLGVPDPERDQVVAAVILAEPDTAPDLDALRTELRTRLSAYKVPRRFLVLAPADLPDAVERQARPAARSRSCSMSADDRAGERLTVPALVRRWAEEQPDRDVRRHRRRRADLRRARAPQRRAGRALRRPRSGQGHAASAC